MIQRYLCMRPIATAQTEVVANEIAAMIAVPPFVTMAVFQRRRRVGAWQGAMQPRRKEQRIIETI